MPWMDLRRYVFAYVLNRLSVFTDLDSDQLEVSGSSFSVKDLAIDPTKISSPSLKVNSASASSASVELSTNGIYIKLEGLNIDGTVKSISADLGLSTVLEQTQADFDENLEPQVKKAPGFMAQKISEIALAQLRIDIQEIIITLHVGQLDIVVDIGLISFENRKITFEAVNVTCQPVQPIEELPLEKERTVRFADSPGLSGSESSHRSVEDTLVLHIANGSIKHDFPLSKVDMWIGTANANVLPMLSMVVACINVILEQQGQPLLQPEAEKKQQESGSSIAVSCIIDEIRLADCALSSDGQFESPRGSFSLKRLCFANNLIKIDSFGFPGFEAISPVLEITIEDDGLITIEMPTPLAVKLTATQFGLLIPLLEEMAQVLQTIATPEAEDPARVNIILNDISLSVNDLSILILPSELNMERLLLSEVLVTAGTDRMVVSNLEYLINKRRVSAQKVSCQLSHDTIAIAQQISEAVLSQSRKLRVPTLGELRETTPLENSASKPSTRFTVDSVVISGFDGIISTPIMASYNGTWRAKLKPELVYDDHRLNLAVQMVMSEMLVIYIDVVTADMVLKPPIASSSAQETAPQPESTGKEAPPFRFSVPIDLYIKGQCGLSAPGQVPIVLRLEKVLNANLKEDWMNVHVPQILGYVEDEGLEVPIATVSEMNLRGNFSKSQFALTVQNLVLSSCADSLVALHRMVEYLKPLPQTVEFTVDGPEGLNVFADVDNNAFTASANQSSAVTFGSLQYVESYYPKANIAHSLEGDFANLVESMQANTTPGIPFSIQEDYLLTRRSASPKLTQTPPRIRLKVMLKTCAWDLYDGYDLKKTRQALSEAVDRVSSISNKLGDLKFEDNETPIVGDLMFNSIYIGARSSATDDCDLQRQIDEELGTKSLHRSKMPKVSLRTTNIKADVKQFNPDAVGELLSDISVNIEEFVVRDLVSTSKWSSVVSYDNSVQGKRRGAMVTVNVETVYTNDPELRITATVAPLRVQIDQDTLEFITRFFEFKPDEDHNNAFDEGEEEEEFEEFTTSTARGTESPNDSHLRPFIQRFELFDLHICLDYRPKKVDYAGLRSGHTAEFMNLFVVEKSSLVLRHVILHAISGYGQLAAALNNVWTPDVRNNQLVNLLQGLGPLKSIIQVAGGIKKFVVTPVKEYRRESGVASGIRRGSTVLARNTANELVRLGVRVINGPRKQQEHESPFLD